MLFSEPSFLFFFLPAVLLLYYLAPERLKNWVLCEASLVFYAWGERAYVVVLLVSIALNWVCGLAAGAAARAPPASGDRGGRREPTPARRASSTPTSSSRTSTSSRRVGERRRFASGSVHLPIGISFFAFQGMSYVIDVYRGDCPPQKSLLKLAMYKSFFPQLIAGPIVRYADVRPQIVGPAR